MWSRQFQHWLGDGHGGFCGRRAYGNVRGHHGASPWRSSGHVVGRSQNRHWSCGDRRCAGPDPVGLVSSLAAGDAIGLIDIGAAASIAIGFLVLAVSIGMWLAPRMFNVIDKMNTRGILLVAAFSFMLIVAALADMAGSAMIIGAFAAGLVLSRTNQFDIIESQVKPVSDVFAPVFFLSIGAHLDLGLLNPFAEGNLPIIGVGLGLFVIAVLGKVVAGWAVRWRKFNRLAVGFGMMPRGEVGLIFAQIGLSTGIVGGELFSAIILMVIGTTFIAPFLLKWSFRRWGTN